MTSQLVKWIALGSIALAFLRPPPVFAAQDTIPLAARADTTLAGPADKTGEAEAQAPAAQEQPFTMRIGARIQARYGHFIPDDGDDVGAFGIRRARLAASGDAYEHFRYALQLELAGGSATLLDANIRVPLAPLAEVWVGQGKTPFGRQQLSSSGNLQLVDRSIANSRFTHGRDVGLMLQGEAERFGYNVGAFNGEGISSSSNTGGRFLTVARAYVTPLGRYAPTESAFDFPRTPRVALGVSVLHNPLGVGDLRTDRTRYGGEAAFKLRGLDMLAEYFRETADTGGVELDSDGWHAQIGYLLPGGRHSIAGRFAAVDLPGGAGQEETGIGYSYYLRGHRAKLQADVRNLHDRISEENDQELRIQLQLTM